ncbi:MAG: alanyl-tRNA synthetase [Chitinophagaceae bacterium]
MNTTNTPRKEKIIRWVKKLGFWGFLFFLVKGLIWLALGYWVFKK